MEPTRSSTTVVLEILRLAANFGDGRLDNVKAAVDEVRKLVAQLQDPDTSRGLKSFTDAALITEVGLRYPDAERVSSIIPTLSLVEAKQIERIHRYMRFSAGEAARSGGAVQESTRLEMLLKILRRED